MPRIPQLTQLIYGTLLLICLIGGAQASPASDFQRLQKPMETDFKKPMIVVYPLIDQSPLQDAQQQQTGVTPHRDLDSSDEFARLFSSELSRGDDSDLPVLDAKLSTQPALARAIAQRG